MTIALFEARALTPLVNFLERNGFRAAKLLDQQRIPVELVRNGGWVTKKQAYDFVDGVVRDTQCEKSIVAAYQDFQLENLGPISNAMRSCKTVKEALDAAIQLGSLAYQGSRFRLTVEGETAWMSYSEPKVISPGQEYLADLTLMVYYHLIRATVDPQWRPQRLRAGGAFLDRWFDSEILADCQGTQQAGESAIGFPARFLSRRLAFDAKSETTGDECRWHLGPEDSDGFTDSLCHLIASQFPYRGLPTLERLALIIDVSPATLKRKLTAAGTTYGKLLDRIRFDTACELLALPEMSVRDVACELGYSGTSNFVRSFRRMTGTTPGAFQRELIG